MKSSELLEVEKNEKNIITKKRILITGNGFDLYHNLPTNYIDFMDVVNRLIKLDIDKTRFNMLAFVFGKSSPLYKDNKNIKKCYDTYEEKINGTAIENCKISEMLIIAKENLWFHYFNMCIKNCVGWIDFEKEIRYVIEKFELFFKQVKNYHEKNPIESNRILIPKKVFTLDVQVVINTFDFFENFEIEYDLSFDNIEIDNKYCIVRNTVNGTSQVMGIDEKQITDFLAEQLDKFSRLFELYIEQFINKISIDSSMANTNMFNDIDAIITFNYTDTYKNIYNNKLVNDDIEFIHGKAGNNNVVFGINSDSHDELENLNENYIKFKKEFRRMYNGNLLGYRKLIDEDKIIEFIIFGHSLDETDKDILKELITWENAHCIIYCLTEKEKSKYIINLYKFFGLKIIKKLEGNNKLEFRMI